MTEVWKPKKGNHFEMNHLYKTTNFQGICLFSWEVFCWNIAETQKFEGWFFWTSYWSTHEMMVCGVVGATIVTFHWGSWEGHDETAPWEIWDWHWIIETASWNIKQQKDSFINARLFCVGCWFLSILRINAISLMIWFVCILLNMSSCISRMPSS